MSRESVFLGLGSNVGDRAANLRAALSALRGFLDVERCSGVYRSAPVGYSDQPEFWNLVLRGTTGLEPSELLRRTREVERSLGRRETFRNAPRPMDIDILLFGERSIHTADLQVPHPRMRERAFVLKPLLEIAPEAADPVSGVPLASLAGAGPSWDATERVIGAERLLADEDSRQGELA